MIRIISCICIAVTLLATGCKKGDPVTEQHFGFVKLELLALPGTPSFEIYMDDIKLSEQLVPGPGSPTLYPLEAGRPTKISFRKPGSATAALDTVMVMEKGEKTTLRIAYSEDLSMKGFVKSRTGMSMDSISIQLFNKTPESIQPAGMRVDGILSQINNTTGEFEEVAVFENLARLQLHPRSITLPVKDAGGMEITYFIRLKNMQTGAFLVDGAGNDLNGFGGFEPGKEHIVVLGTFLIDFGNGPIHFFTMEPIVL